MFLWKQFRQYLLHRTVSDFTQYLLTLATHFPLSAFQNQHHWLPFYAWSGALRSWDTIKHPNTSLCELGIFQSGKAWSAKHGSAPWRVPEGAEVFHSGLRYFTELSSAFSKSAEVGLHRVLGKHSCDAKTYCKFLFNILNTAYRVEISFTLTPQFYK